MAMNAPEPMHAETVWPTTLYHRRWHEHDGEAAGILEFLRGLQAEQKEAIASGIATRAKSERGLYESPFDLFTKPHPGLQKLVRFIAETLSNALTHIDGGRYQPHQWEFLLEAWYHITNDSGFHDAHYHPNCSWCGIYYLHCGEASQSPGRGAPNGGTRFYSPIRSGYRDAGNQYLMEELDVPIQDGLLLLFPSYLQHSGLPYRGASDRAVIAFNAQCRLKSIGTPSPLRGGNEARI